MPSLLSPPPPPTAPPSVSVPPETSNVPLAFEIKGTLTDQNPSGLTNGFVTVNGVNLFYHLVDSNSGNSPVPFDVFAAVTNGSTIDMGVDADGDGGFSDATGLTATISIAPEPALGGAALAAAMLLRRRSRAR